MLFGEAPANRTASWRPSPDFRGSFDILSSCIITLSLCVWSAVHLNIPKHNPRPKRSIWDPRRWITPRQWRKFGWLVLGILVPEMVAFTAWFQRHEAHKLTAEMNKTWNYPSSPETKSKKKIDNSLVDSDHELRPVTVNVEEPRTFPERYHPWTHVHSFFAGMGGFAVDTSKLPINEKYLPRERERVVLPPKALLYIAEHESNLIPEIPQSQIEDKAKASALAKTIVCLQASWFCIQCIYRLAAGLSISLLELSTFGHAICALLMYYLWWDKPLDIEEPVLITERRIHGLAAMFCFWSHFDGNKDYKWISFPRESDLERCYEELNLDLNLEVGGGSVEAMRTLLADRLRSEVDKAAVPPMETDCRIPGTVFRTDNPKYHAPSTYSAADRRRLNMSYGELIRAGHLHIPVCDTIHNWPVDFQWDNAISGPGKLSFNFDSLVWYSAFILSGLLYGGLHLLAWNAPFTSHMQQLLWRISAIGIAGSGLHFLGCSVIFVPLLDFVKMRLTQAWGNFWGYAVGAIYGIFLGFYALARTYLVVECFISLAYLPDIVFVQPQWSAYFPHIQ